jgi:omega-6 fatty acid desaturase (delta-12 desaturase)
MSKLPSRSDPSPHRAAPDVAPRRGAASGASGGAPPLPAELAELKPRDAVGLLFVVTCAGVTGLGLFLSSLGPVVAWLTGQILLAAALLQWFVLLHECGHETLFRTRRLHATVGHVAGFFSIIPFHCWKRVHGRHHKWTGWQDVDPTTAALVPRRLHRAERALVNVCWRYWIPLFSVLYRIGNFWHLSRLRALFPDRAEGRRLAWNIGILLGAYAGVIALVGVGSLVRLAGLGLLLALIFEDPLLLSQHTHLPQNLSRGERVRPYPAVEQEVFTRSLRFPAWFSTGVLLHLDAHELHHMYPFVPGYALRRVDYAPDNEMHWWRWVRKAKRVPGEVFLFQSRTQTGFDL